jgi:alpha-tubulin suppressor-like RCC1 family protein
MPTFYNYTEGGQVYSFDDVFVPAEPFRQGNLWVWGDNAASTGALGINRNTNIFISTPVTTFAGGSNWKQVSIGKRSVSTTIKTDGTLWTWGQNSYGGLGDNTLTSRLTPVTTFAGGNNWKQVSSGYHQIAAIKTDGTLWTWGDGRNGAVGNNTSTSRSTPVTTFAGGTNWKQVACGSQHMAAIKTDGTLWTWGDNYGTKLGINATGARSTPVTTFAGGTNWKQVSCANNYTAAIKTDGTLWTWGANYSSMLGDNTSTSRLTPVTTFAGGNNWKQVSCGRYHASAIKTDGTLWIWGGSNIRGHLGINTTTNRLTPVTTFAGGTNWKQVECGSEITAAIKTDGTLWVWGRNAEGQSGDNTSTNRLTPVTTFAGGTNWKMVSATEGRVSAIAYIDDYQ